MRWNKSPPLLIPRYVAPNACPGVGGLICQVLGWMTGLFGSGFHELSVQFPLQTNFSFLSFRWWWDTPALTVCCLSAGDVCEVPHFCSILAIQPLTLGTVFALCGIFGATGFEVLSINPALASLQRKESGVVKAPHWVAGDLSSALHSATKKISLLILGAFLTLSAPPQFPHL